MGRVTAEKHDRAHRGGALKAAVECRPGLTIKTLCDLAGVSGPTYRAAVRGEASEASYLALEDALKQWDANPMPVDKRVIVVELEGVLGVSNIRISGHADAVQQISESVRGVLESIRGGGAPEDVA